MTEVISNVFDNPLILKTILSHVSNVADLKQVRLVSRVWLKESLEKWRSTGTVCLLWKSKRWLACTIPLDQKAPYQAEVKALGPLDFIQLWEKSLELGVECPYQLARRPFARYRITNCNILDMHKDSLKNLGDFLDIFGPHMKYLNLDHSALQRENHEDILRWIICEKANNLEELTLCLFPTEPWDDRARHELKWSAVLPLSKLRKLSVGLCQGWSGADKLSNWVEWSVGNREKSLSGMTPSGINFPHLTQLYLYSERVIRFKALGPLKALKVLWIDSYKCTNDWNQRIALEAEEVKNQNQEIIWGELEHLHVDYYRFNPNTLRTLGKWMPNLRGLQLIFAPSTRSVAQQLWPNLGELTDLNSAKTRK